MGLQQGRETAKALYLEVLALDENHVGALTGLALIPGTPHHERIELLLRAAEVRRDVDNWMNLGFSQWDAGRFKEAEATFERVLDMARQVNKPTLSSAVLRHIRAIRRRHQLAGIGYSIPDIW